MSKISPFDFYRRGKFASSGKMHYACFGGAYTSSRMNNACLHTNQRLGDESRRKPPFFYHKVCHFFIWQLFYNLPVLKIEIYWLCRVIIKHKFSHINQVSWQIVIYDPVLPFDLRACSCNECPFWWCSGRSLGWDLSQLQGYTGSILRVTEPASRADLLW